MLTNKQKSYLRGLGHNLNHFIRLGSSGISTPFLKEVEEQLKHHELVKVRLTADDQSGFKDHLLSLTSQLNAEVVQSVGHTTLLYRRAKEPKIRLP